MSDNQHTMARYSPLTYHVLPKEVREQFFSGEDIEGEWKLYELLHPEDAKKWFSFVEPLLNELISELDFKREVKALIDTGDTLGAARMSIMHKASKMKWEKD